MSRDTQSEELFSRRPRFISAFSKQNNIRPPLYYIGNSQRFDCVKPHNQHAGAVSLGGASYLTYMLYHINIC